MTFLICSDRHSALSLLLELSIQKGTLLQMLDMVRLLFSLWSRGQNSQGFGSCAPLIPYLKRLDSIEPTKKSKDTEVQEDEGEDVEEAFIEDANQSFLDYLDYPADENCQVDLQQVTS